LIKDFGGRTECSWLQNRRYGRELLSINKSTNKKQRKCKPLCIGAGAVAGDGAGEEMEMAVPFEQSSS